MRLDSQSNEIVKHLETDHKWIHEEIAIWLHDCDDIKFKKMKIKRDDYLETIFSAMVDDRADARRALNDFYFQNKKNTVDSYSSFQVTDQLIEQTYDIFHEIQVRCLSNRAGILGNLFPSSSRLMIDKHDHNVKEYVDTVAKILEENR